jgi:hypothetical protein
MHDFGESVDFYSFHMRGLGSSRIDHFAIEDVRLQHGGTLALHTVGHHWHQEIYQLQYYSTSLS